MDKKGIDERQVLWIVYPIIMVVVTLAVISFVNNAASRTGLDEEYYSKDLAYMLDLIAAGNGDVEYLYQIEENKFDFFIGKIDGKNYVVVGNNINEFGRGDESKSFVYNSLAEFGRFEKPNELKIIKKEGKLSINEIAGSTSLKIDDYLSGIVSQDKFGSYRWQLAEILDDGIIVRKSYLSIDDGFRQQAGETSKQINDKLKGFEMFIKASSAKYVVSESLIKSVVWKESTGNPGVINENSGAVGLMQILPSTAGKTREELLQPEINIDSGTKYLLELIEDFAYDEMVLASYNWGRGNVRNNCRLTFATCNNVPKETRDYVDKVITYRNSLDINSGRFETGREGEAREIRIGKIEILDDKHTVELVKVDKINGADVLLT